jgi:anti-sigma factor RsiW
MNDPRNPGRDFVPDPSEHLSEWTLELLAEGELPAGERKAAAAHVETCLHCASEVEAYRALFASLAALPSFAPSIGFADAVMARVRLAPQESPLMARLRRWLPTTTRGWIFLALACLPPALPILALVAWVLSQPVVSPVDVGRWGAAWLREAGWATLMRGVEWFAASGTFALLSGAWSALATVPTSTLSFFAFLIAVAVPLSAWTLVHLLRTPAAGVAHAN